MMSESLISSLDHRKSFSTKEVSEFTGLSIRQIQKMAKEGSLPGAFQPRRGPRARWRFKREPLERWWQEQGT
jgi:excisionase family DNA binding protein